MIGKASRTMLWTCVAFAAATFGATGAQAEGAIAIGIENNDPKAGIAVGMAWDHEQVGEAKYEALIQCLAFVDAGLERRVACKVVATFRRQCVSVAFDPEPGTPGFGWSVGKDQADANSKALGQCRAAAGDRASFCAVALTACDSQGGTLAANPSSSTMPVSVRQATSSTGRRAKQ
jgi:Domain of unknown function (DUF4189)